MRSRITVQRYTDSQDEGGGTSATLASSFQLWAKVEDRTGQAQTTANRPGFNYEYKITVRHDKLNPVLQTDIISYNGKQLSIQSLQNQTEGKNFYLILRCTIVE